MKGSFFFLSMVFLAMLVFAVGAKAYKPDTAIVDLPDLYNFDDTMSLSSEGKLVATDVRLLYLSLIDGDLKWEVSYSTQSFDGYPVGLQIHTTDSRCVVEQDCSEKVHLTYTQTVPQSHPTDGILDFTCDLGDTYPNGCRLFKINVEASVKGTVTEVDNYWKRDFPKPPFQVDEKVESVNLWWTAPFQIYCYSLEPKEAVIHLGSFGGSIYSSPGKRFSVDVTLDNFFDHDDGDMLSVAKKARKIVLEISVSADGKDIPLRIRNVFEDPWNVWQLSASEKDGVMKVTLLPQEPQEAPWIARCAGVTARVSDRQMRCMIRFLVMVETLEEVPNTQVLWHIKARIAIDNFRVIRTETNVYWPNPKNWVAPAEKVTAAPSTNEVKIQTTWGALKAK